MLLRVLLFTCIFIPSALHGQITDYLRSRDLKEVTITSYSVKNKNLSSINIETVYVDSSINGSGFNITEMLTKLPGITMLSTGGGISKPVIRGLYGNRILVLLSGLKFDNQQWQEEHGLGLSSIGISKIEVIKGPIGTLYGTEAIGGVINLIEDQKPLHDKLASEAGLSFNTNTLGGTAFAGLTSNNKNKWWRLKMGIDNNADYSDGNNSRVLNSRYDGYYLKASYGFEREKWQSTTHYMGSYNRSGFIFNDVYDFIVPDARWSRKLNNFPAHFVLLNALSSENKFYINKKSILNLNLGVQSNNRQENEGGGAISLNMHLMTFQYIARYEHVINDKNKIIISHLNSFEDNTNYGARKLVPDANMQEANVSIYLESKLSKYVILENGAGVGEKYIKTFYTSRLNDPDKEIHPFEKFSPYYNFLSGMTYSPNSKLNLKLNVATGVRIANLAELSSNGLHEGVYIYEIGDPDLTNEQIYSINFQLNYSKSEFEFSFSPFYNYFSGFIYLTPVDELWFGFPVSRYKQQDAKQYGMELAGAVKIINELKLTCNYSGMVSESKDGNATPYVPAQKITPSVEFSKLKINSSAVTLFTNVEIVLPQNKTASFESATPAYQLWNAGASTRILRKNREYNIGLNINNILNTAYYDHLSRLKNYGILNMGRAFIINFVVKQ